LSYVVRTFWRFLPDQERVARAPALEAFLRAGIGRVPTSSQKSAWFAAFRDTTLTPDGVAWLTRVWRRQERIAGLTLAETDEIAMALEIAVRDAPGASAILQEQLGRTQNPDRKARFAFVMPALSADPSARAELFRRFTQAENRRREPWVLEALTYMSHPLREAHARGFVRPGLELLQVIQRTGDIFFPIRWMDALLYGHRSPEIASEVRTFLEQRPDYPQRLRWTVLSSADEMLRAAALAEPRSP
jgi:aminopeptidase N